MIPSNTRADALHLEVSGVETPLFRFFCNFPGVAPLHISGRNGTGVGRLKSSGVNGDWLQWSAPGSDTFGAPRYADVDGTYILEDGLDPDKYIRIELYTTYLLPGPNQAEALIEHRFENGISHDEVTHTEAAAGDVTDFELTCKNYSNSILSHVKFWIDETVVNLEISPDDITYTNPITEAAAIDLADIAVGGSQTLYLRRTITAGAVSNRGILNHLQYCFSGE